MSVEIMLYGMYVTQNNIQFLLMDPKDPHQLLEIQ